MLKTRLLAALALGSLALSPAAARDTRSGQSLPPPAQQQKGSPVAQQQLAVVMQVSGETCDAPGRGQKNGHENSNGLGHLFAPGRGHLCDGKSPG